MTHSQGQLFQDHTGHMIQGRPHKDQGQSQEIQKQEVKVIQTDRDNKRNQNIQSGSRNMTLFSGRF